MGRGQNKLHHMQRIIRGSTSLLRSGRIHQQEGGAGAGAGAAQEQEQEQEELRNRGTRCRGALEYWSIVGLLLEHWSIGAEVQRRRGAEEQRQGGTEE